MMNFTGNREVVVQFAADILLSFPRDLQSITIISQASSEVFSVNIVIGTSLEGIVEKVARIYSLQRTNTSQETTQGG